MNNQGFTLIELMIVIVILAIIASIAIPSYSNYVKKAHIKAAQSDLVALSLVLENTYQRTLSYPVQTTSNTATTKTAFSSWNPSETIFSYKVNSTAGAYTITATKDNCTLTMSNTSSSPTSCDTY
ncbi:prepilin-type N-terminal cleavage/methylation domain-containing protein [Acinetobacter ursingii]|jgi:type IV pilus assembly protein PilE|uniref:type IV pilin protein n=1 Tax=Acinetobacter TaxID=469 RepID=UPI00083B3F87|nr:MULTISPECIES: type IV pilin protein [Acinetobacter]AXQ20618.1 prepilin-type N-terminal cleavage/methylation domain-containing protein [Acinetobacter wuhouensis]MDH2020968.1 prepilin-type N-terminal cleavage/methylation domain-containing protein [Acinetobacter ursingii]MDH2073339.1 prepilin-type N-terminal cleavage/methylation domain-containing protein [Acinetobacter ursingii]MDV2489065.1 type IV pilin protein [Acinetobacter johnsonii]TCB64257.1 prepilin-type N-terminal cleavage/methylation 